MSEAARMLESFLQRGVKLWGEGSLLRFRATKGVLTEPMRAQLSASKDAILSAWREVAAGAVEMHPATYGQRALWFLQEAIPDSAAYNIVFTARIRSRLDPAPLKNAFQALVDRHPPLRTTYEMREDRLFQRVHDFKPVWFETHQHAGMDLDTLRAEVIRASRAPFDLAGGPVLRVELFTRAQDDHVLLVTVHHIAVDGWSLFLLLDDLRGVYAAEQNGGPLPAARPAQHVTGFARWQEEMLSGPAGKAHEAYWLGQLSGELAPLNLPTDRPRPASLSARGATLELELGEDLSEAVRELAVREGVTPYVLLLAAYQVLLHRYSGQSEIVVGSPAYGRERAEFANIVGCLINMIPLRGEFHDDPPFREFLARMRRTALDGIEHQDYPFPLMVSKLQPHRDPSRTPVFQTLFILQKFKQLAGLEDFFSGTASNTRSELGGLVLEPFPIPQQEGQFDLSLELVEREGVFRGALKYNVDLFDLSSVQQLARHYLALLRSVMAAPAERISRLGLLAVGEREQQVSSLTASRRDYPAGRTAVELIAEQALLRPAAEAVRFEGQSMTYGELEGRSNRLARHLQSLGVKAETLVGMCLERGLDLVVGILGIWKAGGAYVPLDPGFPSERLQYMLKDSGADVLLSREELAQRVFPVVGVRRVLVDREANVVGQQSGEPLIRQARPEHRAYVIYTSGSTGRPKGVEIEHRALVNFLCSMKREPGLGPEDVLLAVTTLSFDIAGLELFLPLVVGARIELASREAAMDGLALGRMIGQSGATVMQATPATWRMLFESGWKGDKRLKVLCGGEALGRDLAERLVSRCGEVWNLYGPTETTIWSSVARITDPKDITIGGPVANTGLYVLDARGEPVPRGVIGELWIGGAGVARAYLNRPELTTERFVTDRFHGGRMYWTGDLARYLADGRLQCLGRADDQVKIRGHRIELGEIESVLRGHPAVVDCVVALREIAGDPRLVAYVVGEAGQEAGYQDLLRQRLPDYMVPAHFVVVETLPRTPNNKIDRKALPIPEGAAVAALATCAYVEPATDAEKAVAEIFAEVLNAKLVGVQHNFFELGGHSLLATRVVSRLRERFRVELSLRGLFEMPTVKAISQYIDTVLWTATPYSSNGRPPNQERLSFEI